MAKKKKVKKPAARPPARKTPPKKRPAVERLMGKALPVPRRPRAIVTGSFPRSDAPVVIDADIAKRLTFIFDASPGDASTFEAIFEPVDSDGTVPGTFADCTVSRGTTANRLVASGTFVPKKKSREIRYGGLATGQLTVTIKPKSAQTPRYPVRWTQVSYARKESRR